MTAPAGSPTRELTLGPEMYAAFRGVPREWFDEAIVTCQIAAATGKAKTSVALRLAWLKRKGLVECRGGRTLAAKTEIRRRPGVAD